MSRPPTRARAVILLVVLVALVGMCGLTVALTRVASQTARGASISLHARMADELLREAEGPIHDWLLHTSASVVLGLEAVEPRVLVLDDALMMGELRSRVRIEAVDACGPSRINLSTFPIPIIREAMSESGIGGIELVEEARAEGRVPPRIAGGGHADSRDIERAVLVNVSPRWAMHVTIQVASVERAWVAVYAAGEGGWVCEERRVVHE